LTDQLTAVLPARGEHGGVGAGRVDGGGQEVTFGVPGGELRGGSKAEAGKQEETGPLGGEAETGALEETGGTTEMGAQEGTGPRGGKAEAGKQEGTGNQASVDPARLNQLRVGDQLFYWSGVAAKVSVHVLRAVARLANPVPPSFVVTVRPSPDYDH
jgi:hypothetical protein